MRIFVCWLFIMIGVPVFATSDPCDLIKQYEKRPNAYNYYSGIISADIEKYQRVRVDGATKQKLLKFVSGLVGAIINKDHNYLLEKSNKANAICRYDEYSDAGTVVDITTAFRKQLKEKKGPIVDFLYGDIEGRGLCLKNYLKCYSENLEWEVLFFPKKKQYEVWFKMPDGIIQELEYFHFVIKENSGEYVFIGF